jgi:hypothetical protein
VFTSVAVLVKVLVKVAVLISVAVLVAAPVVFAVQTGRVQPEPSEQTLMAENATEQLALLVTSVV